MIKIKYYIKTINLIKSSLDFLYGIVNNDIIYIFLVCFLWNIPIPNFLYPALRKFLHTRFDCYRR